jgi:hypothetical protein
MEQNLYLRPMGLGEILDASVRLYLKNFLPLVIAQLPMTLAVLFALIRVGGTSFFGLFNQPSTAAVTSLEAIFATYLITLFRDLLMYPVVLGAVTKVASDGISKAPSVKEAYRFAFRHPGKLIVTNFIISLAIGLVMGLFISAPIALLIFSAATSPTSSGFFIGGALIAIVFMAIGVIVTGYLYAHWVVTFPVLVAEEDEEHGSVDAMRRSWNLVKGYGKKTFFAILPIVLIPSIIQFSPSFLEFMLHRSLVVLGIVFGAVAIGIIYPLVDCARVVIYFELRVRKEGLDLEKRVETMGIE